jgi:hypothetical protein
MSEKDESDAIYDQIRGILGEHFHNFCFIVMDEEGELFYDYTNYRIGKMLMKESLEDLNCEVDEFELIWDIDEEDDEPDTDADGYELVD